MARHLTADALLKCATRTHGSAVRLARPGRFFAGIRAQRFVRAIDEFMHALHQLSPHEASRVTPEQEARMRELIDGIVEDVERFLSAHAPSSLRDLKRNQRLAARVYELRQAFEAIARHTTPNPHVVDLRRQVRLDAAHRKS